jgi:hypothetical protein
MSALRRTGFPADPTDPTHSRAGVNDQLARKSTEIGSINPQKSSEWVDVGFGFRGYAAAWAQARRTAWISSGVGWLATSG